MHLHLATAAHTEALGAGLAHALRQADTGATIALRGDLGAGKTTLARALIIALGHSGAVVSPTYTLVEPYSFGRRRLLHLDLYRIGDPEELEYLGCREWDPQQDWILVEWPENGAGFVPACDLEVVLDYAGRARCATLVAASAVGSRLLMVIADEKVEDSALF